MAQTITAINACNAVIKAQATEGQMVDISGSSNEATMRLSNDMGMLRTFGARWPVRAVCSSDAAITLRVVYSTSQVEAMQLLKDWFFNHYQATRRIQIFLPDADAGSDQYQFDCKMENLEIPVASGTPDPILVTVSLVPTGEFTWNFVAS